MELRKTKRLRVSLEETLNLLKEAEELAETLAREVVYCKETISSRDAQLYDLRAELSEAEGRIEGLNQVNDFTRGQLEEARTLRKRGDFFHDLLHKCTWHVGGKASTHDRKGLLIRWECQCGNVVHGPDSGLEGS